jgi:hypothetical protein
MTTPATPTIAPESTQPVVTPAAAPTAPVVDAQPQPPSPTAQQPANPSTLLTDTQPVKPEGTPPEAKPTEAKVVPEKYDLKLPEASLLDASHVEKLTAFAKERGLSNDEAQALLERENQGKGMDQAVTE